MEHESKTAVRTGSICGALACASTLLALAGCIGPGDSGRRPEYRIDRANVDIVAADSTRQLTYLKDRGSTERFCRGPGADSAGTASQGVSLGVPLYGAGGTIGESTARGAVGLGGRDPAVLLARELMYRACELASNTNADAATERQIYLKFLDAVVAISKAQTGAGAAALASEPAAAP